MSQADLPAILTILSNVTTSRFGPGRMPGCFCGWARSLGSVNIVSINKHCIARLRYFCVQLAVVSIAGCASTSSLPDPLEAGWNGSPVCERLFEDSKQRILRCTFPPGVGHERHFHIPHFGYTVIGGQMKISDNDGVREFDVPTGSSFTSDGVVWHEVMNVGNSTAVFLIVEQK